MTSLLAKAFDVASKLPTLEQNILARTVLDEIESEKKWGDLFAESEDFLAQLAAEALQEEVQGITTELDPMQSGRDSPITYSSEFNRRHDAFPY